MSPTTTREGQALSRDCDDLPRRERGTRRFGLRDRPRPTCHLGVLPAGFAARIRPVAGFRNVIVHGDLDVNLEIVHHLLNDRLDDFAEFARLVNRYADNSTKPQGTAEAHMAAGAAPPRRSAPSSPALTRVARMIVHVVRQDAPGASGKGPIFSVA